MVHRSSQLQEIFDIIGVRHPRSRLAHTVYNRAIHLRQHQAHIQSRPPTFVDTAIDTTIAKTKFRGIILVRSREALRLFQRIIVFATIVTLSVFILHPRQVIHLVYGKMPVITHFDAFVPHLTRFGSDQDYPVTGTHTIKSCRTSLQDRDRLDVFGVDILQTATIVYCLIRTVLVIGNRHTIHYNKGFVTSERGITTDHDTLRSSHLSAGGGDLYTGHFTSQRACHIQLPGFGQFIGFHFLQSITE